MACRNERGLRVPLRAARDVSRRLISITVTNRPNVEFLRPSQGAKALSPVVQFAGADRGRDVVRVHSEGRKRKYTRGNIPATGAPTPGQVARPCPPPANSIGFRQFPCGALQVRWRDSFRRVWDIFLRARYLRALCLTTVIWFTLFGSLQLFLPCLGNERKLRARRPQAFDDRRYEDQDFTTNHDHNTAYYTMDKLEEIPDITRVRVRPI